MAALQSLFTKPPSHSLAGLAQTDLVALYESGAAAHEVWRDHAPSSDPIAVFDPTEEQEGEGRGKKVTDQRESGPILAEYGAVEGALSACNLLDKYLGVFLGKYH